MRIKSLGIKRLRVDDTTPADAFERLRRIKTYLELRAIGWSRSTCYRWRARHRALGVKGLAAKSRQPRRTSPSRWTRAQERAVWRMRRRYLRRSCRRWASADCG